MEISTQNIKLRISFTTPNPSGRRRRRSEAEKRWDEKYQTFPGQPLT
jgi:hypothetical protein